MKNFTDMKQIRTWCGNIMNKKFLSRATDALSLRYPYTILILFALLGINNPAWGNSVSSKNSNDDVQNGTIVMSGNHATFTFTAGGHSISATGGVVPSYSLGSISASGSRNCTFTWEANSGCTIKVTKIEFDVRSYHSNVAHSSEMKAVFDGETKNIGTIGTGSTNFSKENSNGFSNGIVLQLKNTCYKRTLHSAVTTDFYIRNIKITYTITPEKPGVNPATESVNVTLPENTANPTTINFKDNFSTKDHFGSYIQYAFGSNPNSKGVMSGDYFYATEAGTYTIYAYISALDNCHAQSANSSNLTITVNPLTPTLTYKNATLDKSVSSTDKTTLNLNTLKTAYSGNGTISYTIKSGTGGNISGSTFYATSTGTFTITATASETKQYAKKTTDFTITVNKRKPTVHFLTPEHIYSADLVENIASLTYNDNAVTTVGTTLSSNNSSVLFVEGQNIRAAQNLHVQTDVVITVTTDETEHYSSVTATHTYTIEPKATPVFRLNGEELSESPVQALHLLIGETANMAFENTDESNGRFIYPLNPQHVSYAHNSGEHTGVITATVAGDEVIQFHQTGTTTIFDRTRSVHVYVSKHNVTLTSLLESTYYVEDSLETADVYSVNAPAGNEPAQAAVTISSDNEEVVRFKDGKWRAMKTGSATLTIRQTNNDYWAGDTITATITVIKKTPVITWNLNDSYPWGAQVNEPVVSSNTELPFTVVSSNPSVADYVNGRIEVYNIVGSATFTLSQAGNGKWNAANANLTKTISVYQPQNHVPFTLTGSNYSHFKTSHSGNVVWDNNCFKLGDGGVNEDDDEVIIRFTGIPQKLTFDQQLDKIMASLPGWPDCWVYESADGNDWSEIWYNNERVESHNSISKNLQPSTRYIKFKYNGSIYCRYKNISVTERKEIVAPASQSFGNGYIGNSPTSRTVDINWYNVKTCSVTITGANADCFELAEGSTSIASSLDQYNTAKITIRYLHEKDGNHTATLHIESEDGKTANVALSGRTDKAIQEIIWREDITPLPKNELYAGAAIATSGLRVLLTAEDPTILQVSDSDQVTGIGVGTTRLFAYQAGNTKWAAVRDTMTVEVTNLSVQHIVWTDRLSNVKREDKQTKEITLTAYSDADKTLPITYTLDAAADTFATISGNKLSVTGWGKGYITARQAGNSQYVAVSKTLKLVSRDPNAGCEPLVLDASEEKTLHTIDHEDFTLNGEPRTISFDAKCDAVAIWGLWVYEYYNGDWHQVKYIERGDMGKDYTHYGPYNLNINSTQVRLSADAGSTLTRTFKNVEVTLAKYLRLNTNDMDFSAVEFGQIVDQQFTVDYSNITGALDVELKHPSTRLQVRTTTLGEDCGDYQKNAVVQLRCNGSSCGTEKDTIVISNKDQRLEIPVSVTVIKTTQQITWDAVSPVEIKTTDEVQLIATATSELPVSFTSGNTDIATTYQKGDGTWWLNIKTSGDVEITAQQVGNNNYSSTETTRTYSISKVTPEITALPIAADIILPATLADVALTGGAATVEGTFAWQTPATAIERVNSGYTVVFTPNNTGWYNTTTCTVSFTVLKTPQTITWDFNTLEMFCNADFTFDATASSGLTVRYTTSAAEVAYIGENNQLRIIKGGEVTITAHQDGDDTYAAAPDVSKILTINRFTPEIVELPTAASMLIGRMLSDASLTGGRVELNGVLVEGSFAWENSSNVENVAGVFDRTVIFTPSNTNYYNSLSATMQVVVEKYAPVIITNTLQGTTITYGQPLSESEITGTLLARDIVKYPQEDVSGTYTWKRTSQIVSVGNPAQATVVFTPANTDWYNTVELSIPLVVLPATAPTATATAQMAYGEVLNDAVLTNTTQGVIDGGMATIAGTVEWDAQLDLMEYYEVGTYELPIRFTPSDDNYTNETVSGTAVLTVIAGPVFDGNNGSDWNDADNWRNGTKPKDNDPVVILADAEIDGNVTISGLTIRDGKTVFVKDGSVLQLGDADSYYRTRYGNLTVEHGGRVEMGSGKVEVNNFRIEAHMGDKSEDEVVTEARSGQAINMNNLTIHGDVLYAVTLDPSNEATQGWYAFSVPFEVDVREGVYDTAMHRLVHRKHYAFATYDGAERAKGARGWTYEYNTLRPGNFYMITVSDEQYATVILRKKAGAPLTTEVTTIALNAHPLNGGKDGDQGWNGLGNTQLYHININTTATNKAQIYHHTTNSFEAVYLNETSFVVGSPFFVQSDGVEETISLTAATHDVFYAPQRSAQANGEFAVRLGKTTKTYSDQLFVSASEDATDSYEAGQELTKVVIGTPATAQMSVNAYGMDLCDAHFPLTEAGTAYFPLTLTAPAAQQAWLYLHREAQDGILYLTYEGTPVWNLSESAYRIDLNKGTTTGYGLLLRAGSRQQPTDNRETVAETQTEKLLLNGVMYLLHDGVLYDANGKRVQNK